MVRKMQDISYFRKNMRGVKGVLLIRDKKAIDFDIDPKVDLKRLSYIISYLFEAICDEKKDVRRVEIAANDKFFVFFHGPYVMGVVASSTISVPLLNFAANRLFENAELPTTDFQKVGKSAGEDVPVFDAGYRVSREDIVEGFRSIPEEKWKAVVLERIDGKKSVDDIVEEALPLLRQQNLRKSGGRDYDKEDVRGLIHDFLSTTVLKLKKD